MCNRYSPVVTQEQEDQGPVQGLAGVLQPQVFLFNHRSFFFNYTFREKFQHAVV